MKIYEKPLFFEKNRVYRVYTGGKLLGSFVNDGSADSFYPEEWIASSVQALPVAGEPEKAGVSVIEGTDKFLDDLIKEFPKEKACLYLLGRVCIHSESGYILNNVVNKLRDISEYSCNHMG